MEGEKPRKGYLIAAVVACNLSSLTTGITLGWTNPVLPKLQNETNLDDNPFGRAINTDEASWIGSLLGVGAMLGPIISGLLLDRVGRKFTLIYAAGLPFSFGLLLLAFAKSVYLYYFARFLGGIGVASVIMVMPIFFSEIAEVSNRGAVCSSATFFICFGALYAYVFGPYLPILYYSLICAVIPITFLVIFPFFHKTPYYLLLKGQVEEAEKSLMRYRGVKTSDAIAEEFQSMKQSVESRITSSKGNFKMLYKKKECRKAMIISLCLGTFNQSCGIHVIFFYVTDIFLASGSSLDSDVSSIIFAVIQVLSSFLPPLLIERLGRKLLIELSATGIVIAEIPLGVYFCLKDGGMDVSSIGWIPLLSIILFIISFNSGLAPLAPWNLMVEMFTTDVKSAATATVSIYTWFIAFVVTKLYGIMSKGIGIGGSFFIYAGSIVICMIFTHFYVIETKGKTFEEIQESLRN